MAGRVTGREIGKNKDGAESVRKMQVIVTAPEDVQTVQLIGQTGEESNPPNGSVVVLLPIGESLQVGVATFDRVAPELGVGGKRIYSTDDTGEVVKAEVRLDPDGKITLVNGGGSLTMTPDGLLTIDVSGETVINSSKTTINNNVEINGNLEATGVITAPTVNGTTEVNFAGIPSSTHKHQENDAGGLTGEPQ